MGNRTTENGVLSQNNQIINKNETFSYADAGMDGINKLVILKCDLFELIVGFGCYCKFKNSKRCEYWWY